jgi:hypothetical protein
MYSMKIWGSVVSPGKDELTGMTESQIKIILWDRFPGGFELVKRTFGGYWIMVNKKRVGEIEGDE